jgi:hypothetical protein
MKFLIILVHFSFLIFFKSFSQKDTITTNNKRFISGVVDFGANKDTPNDPNYSTYSRKLIDTKFSFGKFNDRNLARIFSFGVILGSAGGDNPYSYYSNSRYGLSVGYSLEKYAMLSSKLGLFVGLEGNIAYQLDTFESFPLKNSSLPYSGNADGSKNQKNLSVFMNGYPGIIFFINQRWSLIAKVGNLNLANILFDKTVESRQTVQNNIAISDSQYSSTNISYSFSPSFSINNSGIGIRYFLK